MTELIFKKIKLHNFFSFKDAELELDSMGYTIVEGKNNCILDGNAGSNGSGKSSIFNGICFALTGETAQGVSKNIGNIFSDPDDCWVELTFLANGDEFVIKRFKTPYADMKIFINGEDVSGKGVRESSALLTTYLPSITPTLLNSVVILGQGLPSRFTNNHPAARKETLENLTDSDFMIKSIKDKLETRFDALKLDMRKEEDIRLSAQSQLKIYESYLNNYITELEEYERTPFDEKLGELREEYSDLTNKVHKCTCKINDSNLKIGSLGEEKSNFIIDSHNRLTEMLKGTENQITETRETVSGLNFKIKALKSEIKKLDSITDICPTCGQKLVGVKKPDTSDKKAELNELNESVAKFTTHLNELLKDKEKTTSVFETIEREKTAELTDKINTIKTDIDNLSDLRDKSSARQLEVSNEIVKLTNLKKNHDKLLNDIRAASSEVTSLKCKVSESDKKILDIESHLKVVQQMITLAKREFRGILLVNIIEYINKKVKQYSMEVFGNDKLDFILNNKSIDIFYCDKPYENLSGGEKQKLDIIIQLALRDLLSRQLNIRTNLIVLDEIFDNLDLQGCNKIVGLISKLTDIDSIFIISHHINDFELTYDNRVLVEKDETGISTIKIV